MSPSTPRLPPDAACNIYSLGRFVQGSVNKAFDECYERRIEEFQILFNQVEDMAYGKFNMLLFRSVRRAMDVAGLKAVPRLPGDFQTSREWGNHDETHQQRWMTSKILHSDGNALGTLAIGSHHDHSRFRMPRPPEVIALEATQRSDVILALAEKLPEYGQAEDFKDWFSRYVSDPQQ